MRLLVSHVADRFLFVQAYRPAGHVSAAPEMALRISQPELLLDAENLPCGVSFEKMRGLVRTHAMGTAQLRNARAQALPQAPEFLSRACAQPA